MQPITSPDLQGPVQTSILGTSLILNPQLDTLLEVDHLKFCPMKLETYYVLQILGSGWWYLLDLIAKCDRLDLQADGTSRGPEQNDFRQNLHTGTAFSNLTRHPIIKLVCQSDLPSPQGGQISASGGQLETLKPWSANSRWRVQDVRTVKDLIRNNDWMWSPSISRMLTCWYQSRRDTGNTSSSCWKRSFMSSIASSLASAVFQGFSPNFWSQWWPSSGPKGAANRTSFLTSAQTLLGWHLCSQKEKIYLNVCVLFCCAIVS